MQSLILSHLLYSVYYKDNTLENVPKRSWEQCELGDLEAIKFGLSAHTVVSKKTTTTALCRSAHNATQNEKFRTLMIFMASSLHDSMAGATMSVHATSILSRSLK